MNDTTSTLDLNRLLWFIKEEDAAWTHARKKPINITNTNKTRLKCYCVGGSLTGGNRYGTVSFPNFGYASGVSSSEESSSIQ